MASHFLQPLSPNLEQALYDFTVLTKNIASLQGKLFSQKRKKCTRINTISAEIRHFYLKSNENNSIKLFR